MLGSYKLFIYDAKNFVRFFVTSLKCSANTKDREPRVLVIVHAFWLEEFRYIIRRIEKIDLLTNLIICVPSEMEISPFEDEIANRRFCYQFIRVNNRGRDFGSFIAAIHANRMEDWDLVIKLHTKRSQWLWFRLMVDSLIFSKKRILRFDRVVKENPTHLITHPLLRYKVDEKQLLNGGIERLRNILLKYSIEIIPGWYFPAGSMFATSGLFLKEYVGFVERFDLNVFEDECEYNQSSMAHVHERFVGLVSNQLQGQIVATSFLDYFDCRAIAIKLQ